MEKNNKTAGRIRDVIRYIQRFKNALIVIYLDDDVIKSPLFSQHIRDISLIHEAGFQVLIVPGARARIDEVLATSHIGSYFLDGSRVTEENAMPFIKMAAFDVSNVVMTALAADRITGVIGNWVRARGIGIVKGEDYGTAGVIDNLETDAIRSVLAQGFVPIFPCIGWSASGKPYNISSRTLAQEIASRLSADKLFFVMTDAKISSENFAIPKGIGVSSDATVPALNLEELEKFRKANHDSDSKIMQLLSLAENACKSGVSRVHIVDGSVDGALPCEIFSDLGSGTMIYKNNYGGIRAMERGDVPAVMSLMRPFVESGHLLARSEEQLYQTLGDYIVYELDGGIRACAALHVYDKNQAEIAAVAVDEAFAKLGIGYKMVDFLLKRAKKIKAKSVFLLTTKTADWFEKFGFSADEISSLPEKRRAIWNPARGSKVYRLPLK